MNFPTMQKKKKEARSIGQSSVRKAQACEPRMNRAIHQVLRAQRTLRRTETRAAPE